MAEITSPDYPGERLVVCKNPLLAAERARRREELLAVTENDRARIEARVQRARRPLHGGAASRPGRRRRAGTAPHGQAFPDQHRR